MSILPLKVAFLDVGHGDSIVIILPDSSESKRAIVVDTADHKKTIQFLEKNNVKTLELVIISHFDSDHSRGISALIKHFQKEDREVKKICYNLDRISRSDDENKNYRNLVKQLITFDKIYNIGTIVPLLEESEKNITIPDITNFNLSILYPCLSDLAEAHLKNNCNDTSIVLMLNYNNHKILLPGDLEGRGWHNLVDRLLKYSKNINCNILKLPHHGAYYEYIENQTLGTEEILNYACPNVAVISSSQNEKYQHPSINTIIKLKEKRINTYCTQVTDVCHVDRSTIKDEITKELACCYDEYNPNWCPCSGDIIIAISDTINIHPTLTCLNSIRSRFDNPLCI